MVSLPNSLDESLQTPAKSNEDRYDAGLLEYTARKWTSATPPEKIDDINVLRQRCHQQITQIVLADKLVNSAEGSSARSAETHRLERKRWETENEGLNKVIADQQREMDRLKALLKRFEGPCRYDANEVANLNDKLDRSTQAVLQLGRQLEAAEKELADTQSALVASEQAAGHFDEMLNRANEEAEVYRNEVDRYIVELQRADNEVDQLRQLTDRLQKELEILTARSRQQSPAHHGRPSERGTLIADLEEANTQLTDQVYGLNEYLKQEEKLRAQLEYSMAEAHKVNEAQRNRIAYLEARENELFDYGTEAASNITEMMRQMDELDTEIRCLREEKKDLEQTRADPPSYRTSMAQDYHQSQTMRDILWGNNPAQELWKKETNTSYFVGVVTTDPSTGAHSQPNPVPSQPEPERNTSTTTSYVPTSNVPTTTTATAGANTST
ncbi:cingulin-like protein 1 [Paramacrobiotus metropolitanus]|uniref:cingulin-like protein 1 n=1 Tax=Paramacrobiotus metropolitanus TaxID=2943436 RepID=UPI00244593B6|nr:cingulin-like protein 1 [Paramacrobiotus metropolitanus]